MQNGLELERLGYILRHNELLLHLIPHQPMKCRVSKPFVCMGLRVSGGYQLLIKNNKPCWSLLNVLFME